MYLIRRDMHAVRSIWSDWLLSDDRYPTHWTAHPEEAKRFSLEDAIAKIMILEDSHESRHMFSLTDEEGKPCT
jgi:hypothetical protein